MGEKQTFITLMRRMVHGSIVPLKSAPKRQALKVFGGTLSIEEFRAGDDTCEVKMPESIFHSCIVQTTSDSSPVSFSTTDKKMKAIQESTQVAEPLKLRRPKPLQRTESSLEKALKLKKNP
jgi:hypothetical protein